jgi:hypothetical protein
MANAEQDPFAPHSHEPNPEPPTEDPTFLLEQADGNLVNVTVDMLADLPRSMVADYYIVSTGHGTSGPFQFTGVSLRDFARRLVGDGSSWSSLEVIAADGFGTRILRRELLGSPSRHSNSILLADTIDGRPMTRREGLVRLIVPGERGDALRQVKWVDRIRVRN